MAKKIEMYEGRPVFQASDKKQLADAVAKYEGDVAPPYVVRIPDKTKHVKRYAFHHNEVYHNEDIGVVILPDSICYIGMGAFGFCSNLTSINLPESLELIDEDAFQRCSSLSDISIPSSVRMIDDFAFYGCKRLVKITIPASVWKIGSEAFHACERLTEVTFLGLVEEIDKSCFQECYNLTKIIVPEKKGEAYMEKLNEDLHDLIVEQSGSATFDTKEDGSEDEVDDMASEIEMYEGRPVFQAPDSKQLADAVAKYEGYVDPPYVVRVPDKTRIIKKCDFSHNKDIGIVILPDSICYIGFRAFYGCSNLTSINLPKSLEVIDEHAFDGCSSLSDISIPSSVRWIRDWAFSHCDNLTKITIPASVLKIGYHNVFEACKRLTEVTFLGLVEEIDEDCFKACYNLTKIIVPDKNGKAYKEMLPKKLHDLIVEQSGSVTIDTKEDWSEDEENDLASEIEMYEGRSVFRASNSEHLADAVAKYEGDVFPPYVVRIPDKTKYVDSRAFYHNEDIGVVILPDSICYIGGGAFSFCSNLTSINLPKSLEVIDRHAFDGCSSLSDISIPSSVRWIRNWAFSHCDSLTKITIPASVWKIGSEAFHACERLTEVTFLGLVEEIDKDCFQECYNLTKIIVPEKKGKAYKEMLPEELHSLIVEQSGSATFDTKEKMYEGSPVFQASNSKQLADAVAKYEGDVAPPYVVRVPDKTKCVDSRAFYHNEDIGAVILPDSVWIIEERAFCNCENLTSIILPKSLEVIEGHAFDGCSSLSYISIPSSVRMIDDFAFYGCKRLVKITIPASVFRIDNSAFCYCKKLTEVTFLGLVEEIDKDCFQECSNLTKIIVPDKKRKAYKEMLPEELHALIVEMYEGSPVFQASDSKQLADAVAKYEGDVAPPYVVRIPDKTKYVDSRAFYHNEDIGVVILPDSVGIIDEKAFCGCKNLTSINLPESLKVIEGHAFEGCSSLSYISIPSSVRMIDDFAFYGCKRLVKITIPASVWEIGLAFCYCKKLTEVTFLGLVERIKYDRFQFKDCFEACSNLTKIIVPDKKVKAYKKMLPKKLHALIVEQSESATFDTKEDLGRK